jgi:hypothetical protein
MLQVTSKSRLLWLGALAMAGCAGCAPAEGNQTIVLKPGQNLGAIVGHAPEGTEFRFEPGVYRQQTIRPRTGRCSKARRA